MSERVAPVAKRVLAAMSGGVDSAVAAARAIAGGHDVVGVHLALSRESASRGSAERSQGDQPSRGRGCCTASDAADARRAADVLGIPFYVWDMSDEFAAGVVDDFVTEYSAGRTPNPCVRCNERIKFTAVMERGLALGFDAVCTGHYARLGAAAGGQHELYRAIDPTKDQSYVLASLTDYQRAHAMFPLGDTLKADVRKQAAALGLLVAEKPDSHDICFIPSGDTGNYLRSAIGLAPGDIVDAQTGDVVGAHEGAFAFTVGQRRGLGLSVPAPDGQPRYVVDVDPARRIVSVGPPTLLDVDLIWAVRPIWTGGTAPGSLRCSVQIRAHGGVVSATVRPVDEHRDSHGVAVELDESMRGVAPGQLIVFYDGDRVLGAATIERTSTTSRQVNVALSSTPT